MISEWFVEAANHTCGNYDPEVDEVALAGFTAVPSERVNYSTTARSHALLIERVGGASERIACIWFPTGSPALPIDCGGSK